MLRFYFYSGVEYDQNLKFIKAFSKTTNAALRKESGV
jgi:hypothetical protein